MDVPTWASQLPEKEESSGDTLNLYNKNITVLPRTALQMKNLHTIRLGRNNIVEIGDSIKASSVQAVDLSYNGLHTIHPILFTKWTELKSLELQNNKLESIPDLTQARKLKRVNLSYNPFHDLPEKPLAYVNALSELWLNGVNLEHMSSKLVDAVYSLKYLQSLHLDECNLDALPHGIVKLQLLRVLSLAHNRLVLLPEEIGTLESLKALHIQGNRLTALPASMGLLANLETCALRGNQLESCALLGPILKPPLPSSSKIATTTAQPLPPPVAPLPQLSEKEALDTPLAFSQLRKVLYTLRQVLRNTKLGRIAVMKEHESRWNVCYERLPKLSGETKSSFDALATDSQVVHCSLERMMVYCTQLRPDAAFLQLCFKVWPYFASMEAMLDLACTRLLMVAEREGMDKSEIKVCGIIRKRVFEFLMGLLETRAQLYGSKYEKSLAAQTWDAEIQRRLLQLVHLLEEGGVASASDILYAGTIYQKEERIRDGSAGAPVRRCSSHQEIHEEVKRKKKVSGSHIGMRSKKEDTSKKHRHKGREASTGTSDSTQSDEVAAHRHEGRSSLKKKISRLTRGGSGDDHKPAAAQVVSSVDAHQKGKPTSSSKMTAEGKVLVRTPSAAVSLVLPRLAISCRAYELSMVEPRELAHQLTHVEADLFEAITWRELLKQRWLQGEEATPAVHRMIQQFNHVGAFLQTAIVKERDLPRRAKLLAHVIRFAHYCNQLHNYSGVFGIMSALSGPAVSRLKLTWQLLPDKIVAMSTRLTQLLDSSKSYKRYRKELKSLAADEFVIPYFGVILTDLTFIEEGNPTFVADSELINFHKFLFIGEQIRQIKVWQEACHDRPHLYDPNPDLHRYLRDAPAFDADRLYKESLLCEPRNRKKNLPLENLSKKLDVPSQAPPTPPHLPPPSPDRFNLSNQGAMMAPRGAHAKSTFNVENSCITRNRSGSVPSDSPRCIEPSAVTRTRSGSLPSESPRMHYSGSS